MLIPPPAKIYAMNNQFARDVFDWVHMQTCDKNQIKAMLAYHYLLLATFFGPHDVPSVTVH
jgi:hypothetical protein